MAKQHTMMSRKKRISIYVRNQNYGPSDYYRIIQYISKIDGEVSIHNALPDSLFRKNLDMNPSIKKRVLQLFFFIIIYFRRVIQLTTDLCKTVDVIIIQREVFPRYLPVLASILLCSVLKKSQVVWDFDDDIFEGEISTKEQALLIKYSNYIITISEYLKSLLPIEVRSKVITLPTTDRIIDDGNLQYVFDQRKMKFSSEIRLIWIGTAVNLSNLDIIAKRLEDIALLLREKHDKTLTLTIVCNTKYLYKPENYIIKNIKWSRDIVKEELSKAHIGLMPLIDKKFSKGKGGFKLIQYMSTGLPVIASNIGFNKEIIKNGFNGFLVDDKKQFQWSDSILKIISSKEIWLRFSLNAYHRYKEDFSYEKNLNFWDSIVSQKC